MDNDLRGPTLGEVVSLVRGTTYKSALLGQPGPVLLGLASIERNGGFRADSLKTYGGDSPSKLLLFPGDLYVSLKDVTQSGDLLGAIARVPKSIKTGRLTQDTVKLDFGESKYPRNLLYWALRTPQYRAYCRAHATGTTNLGLGREDFLAYRLPAATKEALCLVAVLDALDEKIELNRKQNETLEAMARALFKAWFVDFEPVRAKMEGRWQRGQSLPGLPAHLYDLFPDRLVESELGEIPEGWRVGRFSDVVDIIGGGTPRTSVAEYWGGEIPWFSVVDTPTGSDVFVVQTEKTITQAGLSESSARLIPKGTTIISARGTVGNLAIAGCDMTFNQSCYALKGKDGYGNYFVFLAAQHMVQQLKAMAHGSVFSTITRQTFDAVCTVLPPESVLHQFEKCAASLLDPILGHVNESRMLAQLRDTLLPKLISGELRVRDAGSLLGIGA